MGLTMRELCPDAAQWFALSVKHQHERPVDRVLCSGGIESFLPLFRARRRWSDRVRETELPLFPGYVFGKFPFRDRVRILNTPGVGKIVGFAGRPAPVPDRQIEGIRAALRADFPLGPWPFMKPGDRVRVERGPLRGMEGRLSYEKCGDKAGVRLVIDVELLQRAVGIEVDADVLTRI